MIKILSLLLLKFVWFRREKKFFKKLKIFVGLITTESETKSYFSRLSLNLIRF